MRQWVVLPLIVGLVGGCDLGLDENDLPLEDQAPSDTSIEPVSSAEQLLVQMEAVEFFATQSLATRIAKSCESLNFDFRRNADIAALRGDPERTFGRAVNRRAVRARTAELEAAFLVKHAVDPEGSDLCAAGNAERVEGTALSGTLRPAS